MSTSSFRWALIARSTYAVPQRQVNNHKQNESIESGTPCCSSGCKSGQDVNKISRFTAQNILVAAPEKCTISVVRWNIFTERQTNAWSLLFLFRYPGCLTVLSVKHSRWPSWGNTYLGKHSCSSTTHSVQISHTLLTKKRIGVR